MKWPALLFFFFLVLPYTVFGQADSQSLSVTPPLFQISVDPGSVWQSSVRVVNTNNVPLTVYAEAVRFVPEGEYGLGKFMPVLESADTKATLAEWIEIAEGPYTIERGESRDISFFVDVPKDAAPGGHFAAILISTEPPQTTDVPLALVTTQTVAALFFARIEGDVIESASIREFSVLDRSIELPEAEFSLRFENKGNVHLQPKGDIVITNMWGKERGVIPINHNTHFGNVLPASIRDFRFSWKGENSLTDIGRYKAVAALAYGEDGVKSVSSITYFWIIPVKGVLITVGTLILFIFAVSWMIRRYVRNMLLLAGVDPDQSPEVQPVLPERKSLASYKTMSAPLRSGVLDLRTHLSHASEVRDVFSVVSDFIRRYYRFFLALIMLIAGFIALVHYVSEVSDTSTEYEVRIKEGDSERIITNTGGEME